MVKENKNIYVTELGEVVNRIMKQCFPSIVDIAFTANLEFLLDSVGEGLTPWKTIVRNFYPDLMAAVDEAQRTLETVISRMRNRMRSVRSRKTDGHQVRSSR